MIEIKNLTYFYDGNLALDDISFKIEEKEKVVLLGTNGSGKSTLLRILAGLYKTNNYFINNKKLKIDKNFRKKVGILFQNPDSMIFNPTVFDELSFALKEFGIGNIEEKVVNIAKKFGIENLLKKSPLYLSGGEKQKVMLASILIYEPEILFLDEPTTAMDPRTTGWFLDLLYELEITTIIATHDLSLAYESSNRALVLNETHKLIYDGEIEELMKNLDTLLSANLIHKHKHKHKNFNHSHYHLHF